MTTSITSMMTSLEGPRMRALPSLTFCAALCAAVLAPWHGATGQQYPLLDSTYTNLIAAEISGDAAFDHIRALSAMIREAGTQYYGNANPDAVLALLRSAGQSGLYRLDRVAK